jgi:hypothetical protein
MQDALLTISQLPYRGSKMENLFVTKTPKARRLMKLSERKGEKTMSLPTGTWQIDANGFRGTLNIANNSVDSQGNLNANVVIDAPRVDQITGFWDDSSQKITFIRIIDATNPSTNQIYTGYLFDNRRDRPTDVTFTLTGYFEAFQGTGGVAQRVLYGWFAQITIPG